MKNIATAAIVSLLSFTISAGAQQVNSVQSQASAARIEQVQLKNGPLADFYELVSQRTSQRTSQGTNTVDELAQKKIKEEQTLASLKKTELDKSAQVKKELDKLPQHSAK